MILLASQSKALCRRWREALAGISPIHEIDNKRSLLHSLNELKPAILFLDSDNIQFGTPHSLREIIQASAFTRVIIFTNTPTRNGAVTAMKLGAKGYGPKSRNRSLLSKAARLVSAGEIWIGRQLVPAIIEELVSLYRVHRRADLKPEGNRPASYKGLDQLSTREREIASLIAAGKHNKAVSDCLSISEKTVKCHLTTIFKKLGLSGRTELALFVSQIGLPHGLSNLKSSTVDLWRNSSQGKESTNAKAASGDGLKRL